MSDNIIANTSDSRAVCISGGFHTQGMQIELAEKGFTVVTVSPSTNGNSSDNKSYLNNIFNRLDGIEERFKFKTETLRQPALVKREEHSLALQFNLIMDSIGKLTTKQDVLRYLKRVSVDAKVRKTDTAELLDNVVLYMLNDDIYTSFPNFRFNFKNNRSKR